jgi:hypothetical protein
MASIDDLQRVLSTAVQRHRGNSVISERAQAALFLMRPS